MFARTRREYDDAQKGGRDVSWPPYGFRGQVLQGFAFLQTQSYSSCIRPSQSCVVNRKNVFPQKR